MSDFDLVGITELGLRANVDNYVCIRGTIAKITAVGDGYVGYRAMVPLLEPEVEGLKEEFFSQKYLDATRAQVAEGMVWEHGILRYGGHEASYQPIPRGMQSDLVDMCENYNPDRASLEAEAEAAGK
jgi:hypothetical protein